jgi:hypothetical protein
MKEITLTLPTDKVDIILQALAKLPWEVSNSIILDIRNQGLAQLNKESEESK